MVAPIQLEGTEGGVYRLGIHMMFKDSLFKANVDISPDGHVKILEETLLIEDIPVIDDIIGQ